MANNTRSKRDLNQIFAIGIRTAWIVYILLDILCVGMGMGVPIYCILLGFPVGWYIMRRVYRDELPTPEILRRSLINAVRTSSVTFVMMAVIWGRCIVNVFDPQFDAENFGHPFFLYDPFISFIGWLVLMIIVAPMLQLLTTVFAMYITLLNLTRKQTGLKI